MRKTEEDVDSQTDANEQASQGQSEEHYTVLKSLKKVNDTLRGTANSAIETVLEDTSEGVKKAKRRAFGLGNALYDALDIFVGLCFLTLVVMAVYAYTATGLWELCRWNDYVVLVVYALGGLSMIFNPRRTYNRSIGIYALIMGFTRLVDAVSGFSKGNGFVEDAIFVYYFVLACFALNLTYSGISCLCGKPRGYFGMMFNSIWLMILSIADIVYSVKFGVYPDLWTMMNNSPDSIIDIFLFFILLVMLDTREARLNNGTEHFTTTLDSIRRMRSTDGTAYVLAADARALCDTSFGQWSYVKDGGPAEREYKAVIHGKDGDSYLTAQKWKDFDGLYLTLSDHDGGTMVRATRFIANSAHISEDADYMYFLGPDHSYVRINIRVPLYELDDRGDYE